MSIFKKQIKFISAICPECKGHLRIDSNLETAFCQYCGAQCIVENAQKKTKKQSKFELLLDFIERQQTLRREEKREQQRRVEREEQKNKEHIQKHWWKYLLGLIGFFAFLFLMVILENQGII